MNFLGHLYFTKDNLELKTANLFGDFVKGKDYSYLPPIVQEGVSLHREIDNFIDHHLLVKDLRLKLYKELPKVAGIAIDLYFDHLLAKNWKEFSSNPLEDFIQEFMEYIDKPEHLFFEEHGFYYPQEFLYLLSMMKHKNWLRRYQYLEGLEMASKGLSKRIAFDNVLGDAVPVFLEHEIEITDVFFQYMDDAKKEFF